MNKEKGITPPPVYIGEQQIAKTKQELAGKIASSLKSSQPTEADFPFKTTFSLVPLINKFWEKAAAGNSLTSEFALKIKEALRNAPELYEPITDKSIIEKQRSIVDALMSVVFPAATGEMDFYAAIPPFQFESFYETPAFKRLNLFGQTAFTDQVKMGKGRILFAYLAVLSRFYKIDTNYEYPMINHLLDKETGLDRYYRIRIFPWFVDIKTNGVPKLLTEDDRKRLFDNLLNEMVCREIINPEIFEFQGFLIVNAVDVTAQEVISSLKYDLIDKDSIIHPEKFNSLQHKIRSLLKKPGLQLGLAALPGENNLRLEYGQKLVKSFVLDESCQCTYAKYSGSIYDRALTQNDIININDLNEVTCCAPIELEIVKQGIRNLTVAPLTYNDKMIGIMELGSPNPGDLNQVNSLILKEVLPLFAMCVKRSMDDLNNQIQAVIKEKCTAIHPSVEWKFRKAAIDYINKQKRDVYAEMEEIVFENVYPLFAQSDIRDSSLIRNSSILADLKEHLEMAQTIVELSNKYMPLPILDKLNYRIMKQLRSLGRGLSSGDESSIVDFLHMKIEPLFEQLAGFDGEVKKKIEEYKSAIDPKLGFLYKKRKDFEESIALINETIAAYIDAEEEKAQRMYPHYFEKYKTDGVEHGIYIGASLVEDGKFNLMYLKNMRLWQMMVMCGAERRVKSIKHNLKVPLDTAHLILVQNSPLSVRFHYDEKKFDVDGTYNIRYEVMKKRIDKAEIRGREERLTQPGKIAIVYSQESEAAEYREYIEYLQSKGYLTNEVEELELVELQGISGLKALRAGINISSLNDANTEDVILSEAKDLING